jgi:predicted phage terminase large subunit-like protein
MAEKARRNLYEFVIQGWSVLEPGTRLVPGVHLDAICAHLQAVTEGRIRNLIINVPPGHAKSLLTAVFWPAWVWIDHSDARWLFSTYREPLATRDSIKCRRLIESDWYQQRWGDCYQLTSDQNQKNRFENTATGYRVVVPMFAGTGERGDYVVVDDPHSVDQAESEAARRSAIEWWNGSMVTRLNDFATGHKVVIQQRLHESDLSGDLLAKGGYEHLCLPAEFEPERRCSTSIGWTDPRKQTGELLWPQKVRPEDLAELKVSLGSYRYAGQYQQRPTPAGGGIFQRSWWRFWRPTHIDLPPVTVRLADGQTLSIEAVPIPPHFDDVIQSWDLAFKDLNTSDYGVGQVWGAFKGDRFLLDQVRGQMDLPAIKAAVRELSQKWPKSGAKLIEDKANGPAVIQELQHDIPGLIPVNPEGGKIARAHAVSSQVEAGNVYLPHPTITSWIETFLEEATAFPHGRNDDQVDAMTQALNRLRSASRNFGLPESQITVSPFAIPDAWPRAYALVVSPHQAAALWGAQDQNGTIYLYSEHQLPHAEPSQNARKIKVAGDWIPGMINCALIQGSRADQYRVASVYRAQGLDLYTSIAGEEASLYQFWERLETHKLKVFASLTGFLAAYRIGAEQTPLLLCCHTLIRHADRMRTQPEEEDLPAVYSGPRSWNA